MRIFRNHLVAAGAVALAFAVTGGVVATALTSHGSASPHTNPASKGLTSSAGTRSRSYRLYTHCGIEWAEIRGTFWRAATPPAEGQGNPPSGWGNPYQTGTLTFTTPTTAVFHSVAGRVAFHRTARITPPFLCS